MKKEFCNPVSYTDGRKRTNPDPYILRWCGSYYCYSTDENGVNVSVSDDLVQWTYHGFAISLPEKTNFWAPAVLYRNGVFYMYFSCLARDADDGHEEFLYAAEADNPLGPFTVKKQLFNVFSIDAHPVEIGDDVFLFYSVNEITGLSKTNAGTCIVVDKLLDMYTLAGNPQPVVLPSIESEIYERDRFVPGQHWYTIEGACYYEHRGTAYIVFSANAYTNTDYYLGYAHAKKDGCLLDWKWCKYPDNYTAYALIRKSDLVEGTGHNTITKAPNLVDDWIVYHGRSALEALTPGTEQRVMRIDPLYAESGRLITPAPTACMQPAPAPAFAALKNIRAEHAERLFSGSCGFYTAELWLSPDCVKPTNRGMQWSVLLDKCSGGCVELELISGLSLIAVRLHERNMQRVLAEIRLPPDFNYYVPHLIAVSKVFDSLSITVDSRFLCCVQSAFDSGAIEIEPHIIPINIHSFALTPAVSLWKDMLRCFTRFYDLETPVVFDGEGFAGDELHNTAFSCVRRAQALEAFACDAVKECIEFEPLCSRARLTVYSRSGGAAEWQTECSFTGSEYGAKTAAAPYQSLRWSCSGSEVRIEAAYIRVTGYDLTVYGE
ncbi:MAG TPA: glycoside hydrolase family 43 protein [Candidatus Treponema faecavium]|nr:glycoside hydrolase family 43 protein [Candidatus Treponema faecavium]